MDPPRKETMQTAYILDRVLPLSTLSEPDPILWFAAALAPFRQLVYKGKKQTSAVSVVVAQGLKVRSFLCPWRTIEIEC